MRSPRLVIATGLSLEVAALSGLALIGDASARLPETLSLFALAALGFLAALAGARGSRLSVFAIIAVALVLRAPLVPAEPSLSDDVWRYLHDGRAQLAGVSPYAYAPADPATDAFRAPWHDRINHPDLVTIYPPFAQVAFLLAAFLGGTTVAWKLLLLVADAAVILLIARLLRDRGRPLSGAVVYAWNPLVVLEVAGSGHLEPIAVAPLLGALVLARAGRPLWAGAALGLSVAAKYFALPVAPFLARERPLAATAGLALAAGAVAMPYVVAGPSVFGSLFVFGRTWSSNGSLFTLLAMLPGVWTGRIVVAALLLALLVRLWRAGVGAPEAAFAFFFATLLLAPVVHPWYLLWILALVPCVEAAGPIRAAALAWSLTAPAAYLAIPAFRDTGLWAVPLPALLVQYVPVFALLLHGALSRRAAPRSATPSSVPAG